MFPPHHAVRIALAVAPFLIAASAASGSIVSDGGFESPALPVGNYLYNATGSAWTFTGNSGVDHVYSYFFAPSPPQGVQAAFLQSHQSSTSGYGAFSQAIILPNSGSYVLSYQHAGRPWDPFWGGDLSYEVLVDSTVIATPSTVTGQGYTLMSIPFSTNAGGHTLTFRVSSSQPLGDNASFIDEVGISLVPTPGVAAFAGFACLGIARRRR